MKQFHIGDILSVITDTVLSSKGWDGIYELLNYMTGKDLKELSLVDYIEDCKASLKQQFPLLANISADGITPDSWKDFVHSKAVEFSEYLEVSKLQGVI